MIFWSKHYRCYFLDCESCHIQIPYEKQRGPKPLYCPTCSDRIATIGRQKGMIKYQAKQKEKAGIQNL
jgi:hypothetical protein